MGTVWTEPEKYLTEIHQALGCHSAYMVEEIERLKDREDELGQQVTTLERDKSQLRADLDAAQRERDEARAQLAMSATLTPRRCLTCARDAALDMRETAASFADNFDGDDLGFDLPTSIGSGIRALPLPDECADCNPLKPESEAAR